LVHTLSINALPDKANIGKTRFGPRYLSDVIPYFIYFMVPAFRWIFETHRIHWLAIAGFLIFVSFWINYRGAIRQQTFGLAYSSSADPSIPEEVPPWNNGQFLQ
jgi:hypothetical protein